MNSLVIPPCPNWFKHDIMAVAPDNTLVYGSSSKIIVLNPKPIEQSADIRMIQNAHQDKVFAIAINPEWNKPNKWVASIGQDKIIKLWDMKKYELIQSNSVLAANEPLFVGIHFYNNDTVVAITESGHILTWKFIPNETTSIKISVTSFESITCSSLCPHASWLLALGLKNGIFLVDIRNGRIKAKIRKQRRRVFSMSWCPAPIDFFPKSKPPKGTVRLEDNIEATLDTIEDCLRETLNLADEKADKLKTKKINPWINLKHADDDEIPPEEPHKLANEGNDFLRECLALKAKIVETIPPEEELKKESAVVPAAEPRKVLKARKKKKSKSHDDKKVEDKQNLNQGEEKQQSPKQVDEKSPKQAKEKQSPKQAKENQSPKQVEEKQSPKQVEEKQQSPKESAEVKQAKDKQSPKMIDEKCEKQVEEKQEDKESSKQIELQVEEMQIGKQIAGRQSPNDELYVEYPSNIVNDLVETPKKGGQNKPIESTNKPLKVEEIKQNTRLERVELEQIVKNDYLLAVALQGGTIVVIKAGNEGTIESTFHVESRSRRYGNSHKSFNDKWMSVCWIAPSLLLCSGAHGELYQWDFCDLSHNGSVYVPKRTLVHQDHNGDLFAIAANIKILPDNDATKEHWRERKGLKAWTIGYERSLLYTTIDKDRNTIACYPTIGHCVFSMTTCQVNPNRIAIGFGDGNIRIWDLSVPHKQYIIMQFATPKHSAKIVSLAWHNTDESILAFGTEEGRIGLLNTNQVSKSPTYLAHRFTKPIYKLEWGPIDGNMDKLGLYACSACIVAIYNVQKQQDGRQLKTIDPQVFQLTSADYITNLAWKPDLSLLAVGTKNGQIQIFTSSLELVGTLYHQVKAIQTMAWHSQATAEDDEVSPKESWLASTCSTDATIYIFDLTNMTPDTATTERLVCKLNGHNKQIHKMVWSPHQNGLLASFSEDGRANVWNVDKGEIISTFINSCADPILAGTWSTLDKDYIITAGREFTIHIWNIQEHPPKEEAELKLEKQKRMTVNNNIKVAKKDLDMNIVTTDKQKTRKHINVITLPSQRQSTVDYAVEDCQALYKIQQGDTAIEKNPVVKLYGTNEDMHDLLKEQFEAHTSSLKIAAAQQVSLWRGDINQAIKDAINTGNITPWLISMAPMASPKLWQEACEAYANKQLEIPKSDTIEIVSYLLASRNITKAIDVLCTRMLHKEALALAKTRLPGNIEIVDEILQKWALNSTYCGRFAVAAQNFIALKKYEEAAKSLYKLNSIEALELALELATFCKDPELHKAINLRYNYFKDDLAKKTDKPNEETGEKSVIVEKPTICQNDETGESSIINETDENEEKTIEVELEEVIVKTDEITLDEASKMNDKICCYDIEDKENLVLESNENIN